MFSKKDNQKMKNERQLVWYENFEYDGELDTNKWEYELIEKSDNNELQIYTKSIENVCVKNGKLYITAIKTADGKYTSARIRTYGKQSWQYGKIQVKAKFPNIKGVWPAIWMLGDNYEDIDWPDCGEIDICEFIPKGTSNSVADYMKESSEYEYDEDKPIVLAGIQTGLCNHRYPESEETSVMSQLDSIVSDDFHVYTIDWREDYLAIYVDEICIAEYNAEYYKILCKKELYWPFNNKFYLVINMAIGGDLGGEVYDELLPAQMIVDWIKVYQ